MFDYDSEPNFDPDGYRDYEFEAILGEKLPPTPSPENTHRTFLPRRLSGEDVQARVDEAYGGRVTVIGNHVSYDTPVLVKCNECGKSVYKKPRGLFMGYWLRCDCPRPIHPRKKSNRACNE